MSGRAGRMPGSRSPGGCVRGLAASRKLGGRCGSRRPDDRGLVRMAPEAFLHYSEAVRGNGSTLDLELRVLASSPAPSSHLWFDGIQQIPNSR